MDRYELLKFVHVAAAMVWVGGGAAIQWFALRTMAARDGARMAAFARDTEWVGTRIFIPSALLVVALGFVLVWDGPYELGTTWVWLSLVLFGISFLAGAGYLGPESKRIGAQIDAEGADSPAVQARIARLIKLSRLDLVLLFAIVFLMVTKPS